MRTRTDFKGFELEATEYGTNLVVTDEWSAAARAAIESGDADGLVLNYARGFRERNLQFIAGLPIRRLDVLARTHADLDPIYSLSDTLEQLSLQTAPTPIDLGRLPRLSHLGALWSQVRDTISFLPGLLRLFLLAYSEDDLLPLANNRSLFSVRMKDRPRLRSLNGIEVLAQLRRFDVPAAPVESLEPLRSASPLLASIDFSYARGIQSIDPIRHLTALTNVRFGECGPIENVSAFDQLPTISEIYMWGSTRILDGDLSPLARLPSLQVLRMNPRKSYTPPVMEIKRAIGDV